MLARLMAQHATEARFVVMAGIYTIKSFPRRDDAVRFAVEWPDATRIVERSASGQHRREWSVPALRRVDA